MKSIAIACVSAVSLTRRMGPNDQYENTWSNGNGAGSEKFDYFDHLAFEKGGVNDAFDGHARNPWLTASNHDDAEPTAFHF